jgi:hypothetical protein
MNLLWIWMGLFVRGVWLASWQMLQKVARFEHARTLKKDRVCLPATVVEAVQPAHLICEFSDGVEARVTLADLKKVSLWLINTYWPSIALINTY